MLPVLHHENILPAVAYTIQHHSSPGAEEQ